MSGLKSSGKKSGRTLYLSLGSNIVPGLHLPQALARLRELFNVTRVSRFYETDPVGPPGQALFWNCAAAIFTDEAEEDIRIKIGRVESSLGRVRVTADKYSPRPIDIDLLPQKDYEKQAFIMIPLAEIAPEEKERRTGRTFSEIAGALESSRKVRPIEPVK